MAQWKVRDVMTREVISVSPTATYRDLVDALLDNDVTAAPVVDEDGLVVGVVSEADLLKKVESLGEEHRPRVIIRPERRHAEQKARGAVAAELMTTPAVTVTADVSVVAAARMLEEHRVRRMPVVDGGGRLIGIVSRRDLLRIHTRPDAEIHSDIVDGVLVHALAVDPRAIDVAVVNGEVTIDGKVETRSLADIAKRLIANVPGVVHVIGGLGWEQDDADIIRARGYAFGTPEQLMRPPSPG
jgi:CBS-domain-containing membrane protein